LFLGVLVVCHLLPFWLSLGTSRVSPFAVVQAAVSSSVTLISNSNLLKRRSIRHQQSTINDRRFC
ncbi:MAG: hypothetical protein WBF52_04140, partial [Geitlerinemataceae cyanobacterium]